MVCFRRDIYIYDAGGEEGVLHRYIHRYVSNMVSNSTNVIDVALYIFIIYNMESATVRRVENVEHG